jgi:hypothetical protein
MTREIWKDVNGYEGVYQVSNHGRLKGLGREVFTKTNKTYYIPERIIASTINSRGYRMASLWFNGKGKLKLLHRIIAETFIPNPENLPQVNHIDGNKLNNDISNLEWVTSQDNIIHAYNHNLIHPALGINRNVGHFVEEDIKRIRQMALEGMSQRKIAAEYGVQQNSIWLILKGKTYNWVK